MSRIKRRTIPRAITAEAWLFTAMFVAAVWVYQSGIIAGIVSWTSSLGPLVGGLAAGAAFSTFITTPFAIAGFVEMGMRHVMPIWQIALGGAVGAAIVDIMLVKGIRSPLALLLVRAVIGHETETFKSRVRRKPASRWYAGLFGAFLIAIPLPTDELGVVFLGASGLNTLQMVPIILAADFTGIYAIVSAARALAG